MFLRSVVSGCISHTFFCKVHSDPEVHYHYLRPHGDDLPTFLALTEKLHAEGVTSARMNKVNEDPTVETGRSNTRPPPQLPAHDRTSTFSA